ncbi:30S ribosomal protein S16 [candidate division CSSED10-310 bacterium]|uniref:Small ribosomal subunit protein bS16 n=1 Tax=candidate division CSSED10-310 bacterium TaxID=2855610 RepID=A0ABV6YZ64_UNCC1
MAVRIRLQRHGSKNRPFFRIVIAHSKNKRNGKFIETIGYFNPIVEPIKLEIKEDRAIEWLRKGALPSERVKNLFQKKQIFKKLDE